MAFFGLTLDGFKLKAKAYLDARDEIAELEKQVVHAASKRDQAAPELLLVLQGVVAAVRGDPEEAALAANEGVAGAVRRMALCLGTFSVAVIGGFLGLNLIRVVSDRVRAQIRRQVSGQVEPLRLLDRGKLQMEEGAYREALDTFRALSLHDHTLVPVVWQGRALKRLGRLSEAIEVLSEGPRGRGHADEKFRRAVVPWNLACYRSLGNGDARCVDSVIELLTEALQNAPGFRESLATENLDRDLVPLLGNPAFERWRGEVLSKAR